MPLPQSYARATAVLVDEFDAGGFERAAELTSIVRGNEAGLLPIPADANRGNAYATPSERAPADSNK